MHVHTHARARSRHIRLCVAASPCDSRNIALLLPINYVAFGFDGRKVSSRNRRPCATFPYCRRVCVSIHWRCRLAINSGTRGDDDAFWGADRRTVVGREGWEEEKRRPLWSPLPSPRSRLSGLGDELLPSQFLLTHICVYNIICYIRYHFVYLRRLSRVCLYCCRHML